MSQPDPAASDLGRRLGHLFRDPELLRSALRHASAKGPQAESNERLEFLGDAVLGLVVAEFLYWAFPERAEGRSTKLRAAVVSTESLARVARRLGLDGEVELGKGLERTQLSDAVLANVVEAVFGAVYLDGGHEAARPVVLWALAPELEQVLGSQDAANWKSRLQEHMQQRDKTTPTYAVVSVEGPPHQREFVVAALVAGVERGRGQGPSKKAAAQAAAEAACAR